MMLMLLIFRAAATRTWKHIWNILGIKKAPLLPMAIGTLSGGRGFKKDKIEYWKLKQTAPSKVPLRGIRGL
jgi:hypothetical protein